jgi:sortase A
MRWSKIISMWSILGAVSIIVAFVLMTDVDTVKNTISNVAESSVIGASRSSILEFPINLKIPKINVNANVESVGMDTQDEMGVPANSANAAWFNQGPRPGEKGTAVIDGHYGWKNGIPAVFDNLSKLKKGDKIYIEDEKVGVITFIVRETRTYKENENAAGVFSSTDGKAHLNLITCGGTWNKSEKSYSNRYVVFSDREDGL